MGMISSQRSVHFLLHGENLGHDLVRGDFPILLPVVNDRPCDAESRVDFRQFFAQLVKPLKLDSPFLGLTTKHKTNVAQTINLLVPALLLSALLALSLQFAQLSGNLLIKSENSS